MARIKIKHPNPSDQSKQNLLRLLAQQDIYATKVVQAWDGFAVITSSEREADTLFELTCLETLKTANYTPILPPDQKAKRTILLFGVDDYIRHHSVEEIKDEVYRVNDYTLNLIENVYKFPNNNIIKITFSQTAPAQKSKEQGLKMFDMRIPHHQIKEQDYTPISTCMRCYAVEDHFTNQCPKPKEYTICSECGSREHKWFDCKSGSKECINCSGPHRTLAYQCPHRKTAVASAKEKKKNSETKTYSAAVSSPSLAPSQQLFSPEAANKILTCLLQAHAMNAADPGCFQTVLNEWLELNGLPKVVAPNNPESFKLLRPAPIIPQNHDAAAQETTVAEVEGEDDEDNEAAMDPDDEEEIESQEDETPAGQTSHQSAKTPLVIPHRPPSPKTKKNNNKTPAKHTSNPNTSTSLTPANLPQTSSPAPAHSNRDRPHNKFKKGLRPR